MLLTLHIFDGVRMVELDTVIAALERANDHWDSLERRRQVEELGAMLEHMRTVDPAVRGHVMAPRSPTGML